MGASPRRVLLLVLLLTAALNVVPMADESWLQSETIPVNAASYTIGADCGKGRLTLYVDGQQIDSVQDDSFPKGNVGLFVRSFEQTDVEVRFDDFVVTELK